MVSRFTQGLPIIKPISSIDTDFVHQVLMKKQEQYDAGYGNMQKMFDAVGGIQTVKGNEKQYLDAKMNEAKEKINRLGNIDYSNHKFLSGLTGDISNIAKDPIVKNAILNKQNYDQYFERLSKLKSDPKLFKEYYSPYNEMDDMEQVKEYLDSGDLNKTFRLNTPTFNIDIDKEIEKEMEKSMKVKRQTPQGDWIYTTEGLTEPELRNRVRSIVYGKPAYGKQMQINAKWKYKDDTKFMEDVYTPMVNTYVSVIDKIKTNIEAEAVKLSKLPKDTPKEQIEAIQARKSNYERQLEEYKTDYEKLNNSETPIEEKKQMYEMMSLENNAVKSFPQSVKITPNPFRIIDIKQQNRNKELKTEFERDMAKEEYKTQLEIEKEQTMQRLGLSTPSTRGGKKSGGDESEGYVDPIGESISTTVIDGGSKVGLINTQLKASAEANKEDFINLMTNMLDLSLSDGNPKVIKEAIAQHYGKGGTTNNEFFNNYVKKTPSYNRLSKALQDGLYAQYNGLNAAYADVLDGKQDTNFSSWEFNPKTQESLRRIQLRSYEMDIKEQALKKAEKEAEAEFIKEEYKGDRKAYIKDRDAKEVITNRPLNPGEQFIPNLNYSVSSKDQFNEKWRKKVESKLDGDSLFQERGYLISKDAIGTKNYANIKNTVGDAINNGGIYDDASLAGDPAGLYGKINNKEVAGRMSDKYKEAKEFEVTKVYADTGIAQVEITLDEKGTKEIGYVKVAPIGIEGMYGQGLNKKTTNEVFNEGVNRSGVSPILLSNTRLPLFFEVRKTSEGKYNTKLFLTKDRSNSTYFNFEADDATLAMVNMEEIIKNVANDPIVKALPDNEASRKIMYDLIIKKYSEYIQQ